MQWVLRPYSGPWQYNWFSALYMCTHWLTWQPQARQLRLVTLTLGRPRLTKSSGGSRGETLVMVIMINQWILAILSSLSASYRWLHVLLFRQKIKSGFGSIHGELTEKLAAHLETKNICYSSFQEMQVMIYEFSDHGSDHANSAQLIRDDMFVI